jgi:hypothetical protein
MITLELNVMGDAYQPFNIPKDSQRSVVKTVHYKVLFAFEEVTMLHPDGVKGVYSIKFSPEGGDDFTVVPEPDTVYTAQAAAERVRRIFGGFGAALYLSHRLFSDPPLPKNIGFKVD